MTSIQLLIISLLIVINAAAFLFVGFDKSQSRKAEPRIPEVYFFFWSIFFASLGVLIGMFTFHHKTKKLTFIFGITLLALQQFALVYLFLLYNHLI